MKVIEWPGESVKSPSENRESASEPERLRERIAQLERELDEQTLDACKYRHAFRAAPSGIIMADDNGKIVMANREAERMFGFEKGEMEGVTVEKLMPKSIRGRHKEHRSHFGERPEARAMGGGRDLFARKRDGKEFPVEIGLTPIESGESRLVLAVVVDITERKQAESALKERAQIIESVHEAVFVVSRDGTIRTWNAGAGKVFGWKPEEAIGEDVRLLLPPDDQDRFLKKVYPRVFEEGTYEFTSLCHHKSGRELTLAVRVSLHGDPEDPIGAIICANDISRQKQLEDEILQISESEQRRIGQDIHDDLCQQLAGIGCLTQVLQQQFQEISQSGADSLSQIGDMVAQANVKAREISRGLAPAVVERDGLVSALEDLAKRTRNIFGVRCRFECPDPVFVDETKFAVQLYRIAQEAVGNAVKHGDAEEIAIRLEIRGGELALVVEDDGRGIPEGGSETGLGLLTMARRAEMLEGELDIHSAAGEGTRITCLAHHSQ